MSKKLFNIMMAFASLDMMSKSNHRSYIEELNPEQVAKIKKDQAQKAIDRKIKNNQKQFTIDGITVWALNEKNAIRKANKVKELILELETENTQP